MSLPEIVKVAELESPPEPEMTPIRLRGLLVVICNTPDCRTMLLAKLPASGKKRKSALAWCNEQNGFQGFDPEDDIEQEWMVVQLD